MVIDSAFGGKKVMPASFREKVLLKASIYHIVAFVNNECMGREYYVVVRAKSDIS